MRACVCVHGHDSPELIPTSYTLHQDGDDYVFMDMSTFDTMPVPKDVIAEQV